MTGRAADGQERGVVVWLHERAVMRMFRPAAWLVLQDVTLDAAWCDGRLVASTSARLVAEHLRIDAGTAATALRTLRDRGVVELSQASGPNGRFGLATYTLHLPEGIDVLPYPARPHTEDADTDSAHGDTELVLSCPWDGVDAPSPHPDSSSTVEPHAGAAHQTADALTDRPVHREDLSSRPALPRKVGRQNTDARHEPEAVTNSRVRRRASNPASPIEQGAFDLRSGAQ